MGLLRNLFGKKPGITGVDASPVHADLEGLLAGLRRYEDSLKALVGELDSGGSRTSMNAELQRLTDLDLGRMIFGAPELERASRPQIERLRVYLEFIRIAAEKAGRHIEGGARPPSSLQGVLDSAMGGAGGRADLPPALRVIIPNILMITNSTLDRIAKLSPSAAIAATEGGQNPAGRAPLDAGEFDRLARKCYMSLEEWYVRSVMTVSGGTPDEMIGKLRRNIDALARESPQIEGMLEDIRTLDERFHPGGGVSALCGQASEHLARFRSSVNGADWQKAVKASHDASEALEAARKKLFGSGFGGVSVKVGL